jgi:hypothetical protein
VFKLLNGALLVWEVLNLTLNVAIDFVIESGSLNLLNQTNLILPPQGRIHINILAYLWFVIEVGWWILHEWVLLGISISTILLVL